MNGHSPHDRRHANLIGQFLRSASTILRNEGEVALVLHVSNKGVSQYDTWNVAAAAKSAQLSLVGHFDGLQDGLQESYVPHKGSGAVFPFHRARTYVFRRAVMDAVYGVFEQELEYLRQEGLERGDTGLAGATDLQLREIEAAQQSRADRATALSSSRQVMAHSFPVVTVAPVPTNFLGLCCTGNDECSACGQCCAIEGDRGVALLPCQYRVCIECLTQMKFIAIRDQSYQIMTCPASDNVKTCDVISPTWLSENIKLSDSDLLRLNDLSNGGSSTDFERAVDSEETSGPEMLQLLNVAQDEQWSRCSCGRVIERTTGCNQITCECGKEFCYVCNPQIGVDSTGRHVTTSAGTRCPYWPWHRKDGDSIAQVTRVLYVERGMCAKV
jgi:hypothetical protein